jgi:hypothetical protein
MNRSSVSVFAFLIWANPPAVLGGDISGKIEMDRAVGYIEAPRSERNRNASP